MNVYVAWYWLALLSVSEAMIGISKLSAGRAFLGVISCVCAVTLAGCAIKAYVDPEPKS